MIHRVTGIGDMPAVRSMSHSLRRATLVALLACLPASECLAQHPDPSRFEYLWVNGNFVPPYKAFPEGRERGEWQCVDPKTQINFNCTFVRGGFERFQYIFRAR